MRHPGAIPGQGASKNTHFLGQNGPWWWAALSAQKSTWQLENGPKHTTSNGKTCVGHFYAPSRCHSRWWCIQKRPLRGKKTSSQAPSYASPKLWPTDSLTHWLTGVKCRATSVANKNASTDYSPLNVSVGFIFWKGNAKVFSASVTLLS